MGRLQGMTIPGLPHSAEAYLTFTGMLEMARRGPIKTRWWFQIFLCYFHAATLGRLLFPIMMKEFFCTTEAAEYKGGRLIYAYKHKGRRDDPASYRGLMLTSVLGKAIRSSFRDLFLPGYRRMMDPTYYSVRASGHFGQASFSVFFWGDYMDYAAQLCGDYIFQKSLLGCGFQYFLFSPLFGEDSHFD